MWQGRCPLTIRLELVGAVKITETPIRQILSGALESPMLQPVQICRTVSQLRKERERVRLASQQTGFPVLSMERSTVARRISAGKKVFILGSGASVLKLGPAEFAEIRNAVSIGFGAWPLHHFVPDLVAFGPTRGMEDYTRVVTEVMARRDIISSQPEVILLRSSLAEDLEMFRSLPGQHHHLTMLYGRFTPFAKTMRGLRHETNRFFSSRHSNKLGITLDSGSSLVRMVSLAIQCSAQEIVLAGVDLATPEYFWEADPKFLSDNGFKGFDTGQSGPYHSTMMGVGVRRASDVRREIPVTAILGVLHEMLQARGGVGLKISFANPLLPQIPVYQWGLD